MFNTEKSMKNFAVFGLVCIVPIVAHNPERCSSKKTALQNKIATIVKNTEQTQKNLDESSKQSHQILTDSKVLIDCAKRIKAREECINQLKLEVVRAVTELESRRIECLSLLRQLNTQIKNLETDLAQ